MAPAYEERPFETPSKQYTQTLPADSPSWSVTDSPSARLLRDFGIQTLEYSRDLHTRLDQRALEVERSHTEALAAAALEHERVRRAAERTQQRVEIELVKERQQREEEESQELLRERQENVEREIARKRRDLEEVRQLEERRRAVDEYARQALAEQERRRLLRQREAEDAKRQMAEREERQLKEEALKVQVSEKAVTAATTTPTTMDQQAPQQAAQAIQPASVLVSSMAERKASHELYVKLHQRLKEVRRFVIEQVKQDPRLKGRIGDMRREIKKSVGQLTGEKGANRTQVGHIT